MERQLNWAVLGTGDIANQMAQSFEEQGRRFLGVAGRTRSKAESFAIRYGIEKVYEDYSHAVKDPDVDIVYVATPHNTHYGFIKEALENGKHVLAEKAIVLNSDQLKELASIAESKGLILAEAQTIYHMPLYKELRMLKDSGQYGKVRVITANFGSFKEYDLNNRFFNIAMGGGALLDIGVYALSAVRSFLDEDPSKVFSVMVPAESGTDDLSAIALATDSGQVATIALSMRARQPKRIMISFENAYLEIPDYPRADTAYITDAQSRETRKIEFGDRRKALAYEVEDMEKAVLTGNASEMLLDYTVSVMDTMTAVRREWVLKYPEEKDE